MRRLPLRTTICVTAVSMLLSGCTTVVEQIQQTTGNQISKVDESGTSAPKDIKSKQYDEQIKESPAPYTQLKDILSDPGEGIYIYGRYNKKKADLALEQMPIGLTKENVYHYLLGLFGENYKNQTVIYQKLHRPNMDKQVQLLQQIAKDHESKPITPEQQEILKNNNAVAENQVLVLVDASGSMGLEWKGKTKMESIKESITQFSKELPKGTRIQVHLFGRNGGPGKTGASCQSIESIYSGYGYVESEWSKATTKMTANAGWTPTGLAIRKGMASLMAGKDQSHENRVILITDGIDNCGTSPVEAAEVIYQSPLHAAVNVIAVDAPKKERDQLLQVAEKSGGNYIDVRDEAKIKDALNPYISEIHQMNVPWQIRALDKVSRTYQQAKKQLEVEHETMSTIVAEEHKHLSEANQYVYSKQKIDHTGYEQIGKWVDQRYDEVDSYIDQRYKEVGNELKAGWHDQVNSLEKSYKTDLKEGQPDLFKEKKEQIVKQIESEEQSSQASTSAPVNISEQAPTYSE